MHNEPILINITLALIVASIGGFFARRIRLPSIVGYLLAGIAIGPFTPGFVGDFETIQQLAELGVIFLMFGVGLHFSFQDLWRVRDIAIPGAMIQIAAATLLGFGLTQLWGWSISSGILLGLAVSVASTVVLLRGMMDHNLLNTSHAQAAIGWLVVEDIFCVFVLVLLPILVPASGAFNWLALGLQLLKTGAFVLIVFVFGVRIIPWILERIAHTRSRELFILAVLAVTLGTAMGSAELFGVSLALGAFVAGAIISQSHLSHQVGADVFTFREAFSVLFFVSIGMLVNPVFFWENIPKIASLTGLVVLGKLIIVLLIGLFFPRPAKTFLVVAVGLSQIGEFTFILGQSGVSLGILSTDQYALILATALISITLNPFMYRLLPGLERFLRRMPGLWKKLEASIPLPEIDPAKFSGHVVIVGFGRVGKHLVDVLQTLAIPFLVIEADAERIVQLNQRKIPTLFGDASNSEVLMYASLERASALVTTLPDETSSLMIVAAARDINPSLPILARAQTEKGVVELAQSGADHIVHPELEGSLELVNHTLLALGYPLREVYQYADAVRRDYYNIERLSPGEQKSLHALIGSLKGIEVAWMEISANSPLVGKSLAEANIRSTTGASVVALIRAQHLVANPKSNTIFEVGDRLGLIGELDQLAVAEEVICPREESPTAER